MPTIGYQDYTLPRGGPIYKNWIHDLESMTDTAPFTWEPFGASGLAGPVRVNALTVNFLLFSGTAHIDRSKYIGKVDGIQIWNSRFQMVASWNNFWTASSPVDVSMIDRVHGMCKMSVKAPVIYDGDFYLYLETFDNFGTSPEIRISLVYDIYYGSD